MPTTNLIIAGGVAAGIAFASRKWGGSPLLYGIIVAAAIYVMSQNASITSSDS